MKTAAASLMLCAFTSIANANDPAGSRPWTSLSYLSGPEPAKYEMTNDVPGLFVLWPAWLASKGRNSAMGSNLGIELNRREAKFGEQLTKAVIDNLTKAGFEVADGPKININPEKPWNVKYSAIDLQDRPLLYTYIESIGVRSVHSDHAYQPTLYVKYCIVVPRYNKDCTYGTRLAYGDGHVDEDEYTHPADKKFRWRSEEDVYQNIPLVEQSLQVGIAKIATGLAKAILIDMEEEANVKAK